jgi:hypothetical protein
MSSQNQPPPASSTVSNAIRAIIAQTKPEDYNGHTEFSRMNPAERLTWLDQAVLFIAAQKNANSTWQVAEPPAAPYKPE